MRTFRVLALALCIALIPSTAAATDCHFVLGFKTLRDLIGYDIVGECLENQHHGANGDALQQTTGGLLVWRKADNWTAFTDGYRTWINGPNGLVQRLNTERFPWEADYAPGGIATSTPTPVPPPVTPTPTAPTPTPAPPLSPEALHRIEQAIAALPLVQRDPGEAGVFWRLARASQPVFWALLEQIGSSEFYSAGDLADIAQIDEATALRIVRMPFIRTPEQGADFAVLQQAKRLAASNLASLQQILSHPRLFGGITDDRITTFTLLVLGLEHPEAAAAIEALPWVQDGVGRRPVFNVSDFKADPTEWEEDAVLILVRMAAKSQKVVAALAHKPWFRDGLATWEAQVIFNLSHIADGDTESALQLVGMPFLETSATADDSSILDALDGVLWYSPNREKDLRDLLAHPALHGGITDDQRATVELLAIGKRSPEIAAAINTLPWVQDGIRADEARAVAVLHEASRGTHLLIPSLAQIPWVRDGLTRSEQDAISTLMGISRNSPRPDEPLALSILEMQFLDSFDEFDALALQSLVKLDVSNERDYMREILSHPTLRDGITDSQRVRLTFLPLAVSSDPGRDFPEVFAALLDPSKTTIEERIISLPLAGPVRLAVVHTRQGNFRTMGILERAIRRQEEFMLEAFPLKYVGVLAAEITPASGGASFAGGMVAIDPGGENSIGLVSHEVGHKYWWGPSAWLAEGGAEVLERVSQGLPLKVRDVHLSLCRRAANLSEIDLIESKPKPDVGVDVFPYVTVHCPYVIGLGLFADLYENLGDMAFRQGFRRLYVKVRDGAHEDTCFDVKRAVCLVREAFVIDAPTPRAAAIAEPIIDFWYNGSRAEIRRRGR